MIHNDLPDDYDPPREIKVECPSCNGSGEGWFGNKISCRCGGLVIYLLRKKKRKLQTTFKHPLRRTKSGQGKTRNIKTQ